MTGTNLFVAKLQGVANRNLLYLERSQTRYNVGEPSRFARFCRM